MSRAPYHRNLDIYGGDDAVSTNEQKLHHEQNIKGDDRFIEAMAKAILRGREHVSPGTTVDLTEPVFHKRISPELSISACGSPAALCVESAVQQAGADTIK